MKIELKFTTYYGQFYINDKNTSGKTDSENFWTDQAFADKLAVEEGILGVSIGNEEGTVNCDFHILESKSSITEFSNFDHVVEASLKISSSVLQITNCPDSNIEFETKIANGDYRVRIYSTNLASTYTENPDDSYKIEMWKENYHERNVLKRFVV